MTTDNHIVVGTAHPVPGTPQTEFTCHGCGESVWLSSFGAEVVAAAAQRGDLVEPWCWECCLARDDIDSLPWKVTPGAEAELSEAGISPRMQSVILGLINEAMRSGKVPSWMRRRQPGGGS